MKSFIGRILFIITIPLFLVTTPIDVLIWIISGKGWVTTDLIFYKMYNYFGLFD